MEDTIEIYGTRGPFGCLSLSSPHKILAVTTWLTCKHYILAQKFPSFETWLTIQSEASPEKAEVALQNQNAIRRPDWKSIEPEIILNACRLKIRRHSEVREALLSAPNAKIVDKSYEASETNLLGRTLMKIRDELLIDGPYDELAVAMAPPWEKFPEVSRYSMHWRMG